MAAQYGGGARPKRLAFLAALPEFDRDLDITQALGLARLDAFYALPEADRDLWIARWHREKERCPTCGHPASECSDPSKVWHANRVTCYATRARLAAQALWDDVRKDAPFHDGTETDWSSERSLAHPYRYDEGVSIVPMLEDLTPDDHFLTP